MRIIILLFLGILILAILVISDFILVRIIKEKIRIINAAAKKSLDFHPISWLSITVIALLFWLIPTTVLPTNFKLEYRVLITIFYWLLTTFLICWYYNSKLPRKIVKQLLLFLIIPAIFIGGIIVPIVTLIKDNLK